MIFLTADNINIIIADNTKIQRHTEHYAKLINALTSEKRCKNRKPTHTVTAAATNDIQLFGLFILITSVFGYIYYNTARMRLLQAVVKLPASKLAQILLLFKF